MKQTNTILEASKGFKLHFECRHFHFFASNKTREYDIRFDVFREIKPGLRFGIYIGKRHWLFSADRWFWPEDVSKRPLPA